MISEIFDQTFSHRSRVGNDYQAELPDIGALDYNDNLAYHCFDTKNFSINKAKISEYFGDLSFLVDLANYETRKEALEILEELDFCKDEAIFSYFHKNAKLEEFDVDYKKNFIERINNQIGLKKSKVRIKNQLKISEMINKVNCVPFEEISSFNNEIKSSNFIPSKVKELFNEMTDEIREKLDRTENILNTSSDLSVLKQNLKSTVSKFPFLQDEKIKKLKEIIEKAEKIRESFVEIKDFIKINSKEDPKKIPEILTKTNNLISETIFLKDFVSNREFELNLEKLECIKILIEIYFPSLNESSIKSENLKEDKEKEKKTVYYSEEKIEMLNKNLDFLKVFGKSLINEFLEDYDKSLLLNEKIYSLLTKEFVEEAMKESQKKNELKFNCLNMEMIEERVEKRRFRRKAIYTLLSERTSTEEQLFDLEKGSKKYLKETSGLFQQIKKDVQILRSWKDNVYRIIDFEFFYGNLINSSNSQNIENEKENNYSNIYEFTQILEEGKNMPFKPTNLLNTLEETKQLIIKKLNLVKNVFEKISTKVSFEEMKEVFEMKTGCVDIFAFSKVSFQKKLNNNNNKGEEKYKEMNKSKQKGKGDLEALLSDFYEIYFKVLQTIEKFNSVLGKECLIDKEIRILLISVENDIKIKEIDFEQKRKAHSVLKKSREVAFKLLHIWEEFKKEKKLEFEGLSSLIEEGKKFFNTSNSVPYLELNTILIEGRKWLKEMAENHKQVKSFVENKYFSIVENSNSFDNKEESEIMEFDSLRNILKEKPEKIKHVYFSELENYVNSVVHSFEDILNSYKDLIESYKKGISFVNDSKNDNLEGKGKINNNNNNNNNNKGKKKRGIKKIKKNEEIDISKIKGKSESEGEIENEIETEKKLKVLIEKSKKFDKVSLSLNKKSKSEILEISKVLELLRILRDLYSSIEIEGSNLSSILTILLSFVNFSTPKNFLFYEIVSNSFYFQSLLKKIRTSLIWVQKTCSFFETYYKEATPFILAIKYRLSLNPKLISLLSIETSVLGNIITKKKDNDLGDDVYCYCRIPHDAKIAMVMCDNCLDWYHLDCALLNEEDLEDDKETFICLECSIESNSKFKLLERVLWKIKVLKPHHFGIIRNKPKTEKVALLLKDFQEAEVGKIRCVEADKLAKIIDSSVKWDENSLDFVNYNFSEDAMNERFLVLQKALSHACKGRAMFVKPKRLLTLMKVIIKNLVEICIVAWMSSKALKSFDFNTLNKNNFYENNFDSNLNKNLNSLFINKGNINANDKNLNFSKNEFLSDRNYLNKNNVINTVENKDNIVVNNNDNKLVTIDQKSNSLLYNSEEDFKDINKFLLKKGKVDFDKLFLLNSILINLFDEKEKALELNNEMIFVKFFLLYEKSFQIENRIQEISKKETNLESCEKLIQEANSLKFVNFTSTKNLRILVAKASKWSEKVLTHLRNPSISLNYSKLIALDSEYNKEIRTLITPARKLLLQEKEKAESWSYRFHQACSTSENQLQKLEELMKELKGKNKPAVDFRDFDKLRKSIVALKAGFKIEEKILKKNKKEMPKFNFTRKDRCFLGRVMKPLFKVLKEKLKFDDYCFVKNFVNCLQFRLAQISEGEAISDIDFRKVLSIIDCYMNWNEVREIVVPPIKVLLDENKINREECKRLLTCKGQLNNLLINSFVRLEKLCSVHKKH